MSAESNFVEQAGETHAQHPLLDTTLCGIADEGDETPSWHPNHHDQEFGHSHPTESKRISCQQCVAIIRFAKSIPPKCLAS
jgi:hypothetical protein